MKSDTIASIAMGLGTGNAIADAAITGKTVDILLACVLMVLFVMFSRALWNEVMNHAGR